MSASNSSFQISSRSAMSPLSRRVSRRPRRT